MKLYVFDWESYYDEEYTLKKTTTDSYIHDDRFKVHGFGLRYPGGELRWFPEKEVDAGLATIDWDDAALVCHNSAFDGAILSAHYGLKPKLHVDTLSMARAVVGPHMRHDLDTLAKHFGLGGKQSERLMDVRGIRDLTEEQSAQLGGYCINDVALTHGLLQVLKVDFPLSELKVIDFTIRMYTEPTLELDLPLLEQAQKEKQERKAKMLRQLGVDVTDLRSDAKLAALFERLGVQPPLKPSPKRKDEFGQPLMVYAFAKADEGMKDLLDHEDEDVALLAEARVECKSTIDESRLGRMIKIAKEGRPWPVMLNYYGAHTGRYSGGDKMNPQNLRKGSAMRDAIMAPPGCSLVVADLSQIEARMVAYVAGQKDLVEDFRNGVDTYSKFATQAFGYPVNRKHFEMVDGQKVYPQYAEGFVGKTCIAEGTLVLSRYGWLPIEVLTVYDEVWDGEEWVCHGGVISNGWKETQQLCGVWLTPDHLVWSGTQWLETQFVAQDDDTLCRALATAAENLPSRDIYEGYATASLRSSSAATAGVPSTPWIEAVSNTSALLGALCVAGMRRARNAIGSMQTLWGTTAIEHGYSTDLQPQPRGVTPQVVGYTTITAGEESACTRRGVKTARSFFGMCKHFLAGITQRSRWIGSTLTGATNQATSGSYRELKTCATSAESQTLRRRLPVYDIASSGPRNRFTVLTESGPLIVHNCILGLGFQTGGPKLKATLKRGIPGVFRGVDIPLEKCEAWVGLYRSRYSKIPKLWETMKLVIQQIAYGDEADYGIFQVSRAGIHLPNGLLIQYPRLQYTETGWMYYNRSKPTKIYGGKATENLIQALAFVLMKEQMARINRLGHKLALQVHDEVVLVVPEECVEQAQRDVMEIMSTPPAWAPDLPVACELNVGKRYGDCK
jgi:hypothetical protein